MKNCNPPEKSHPPLSHFPATPLSKSRSCQAPLPFPKGWKGWGMGGGFTLWLC